MTREAITVNWTMIRMLFGIWCRSRLIVRLESVSTQMTAAHMTTEVSIFVVTASAEQMPSTWSAIGLLLKRGSSAASLFFTAISWPPRGSG